MLQSTYHTLKFFLVSKGKRVKLSSLHSCSGHNLNKMHSRVPAKLLTGKFFTPASSISYHHFYHNSYTLDGSHKERFTGRNNVFPYFINSTEIREVSYIRHVSVTNQALFVFCPVPFKTRSIPFNKILFTQKEMSVRLDDQLRINGVCN